MSGETNDPILGLNEVAQELGVSRSTLRRMYRLYGMIEPPVQISHRRLGYFRSTVERIKDEIRKSKTGRVV